MARPGPRRRSPSAGRLPAWLTRASLFNLVSRVGFSSVFEVVNPVCERQKPDRVWLAALKGERVLLNTAPQLGTNVADRPEP